MKGRLRKRNRHRKPSRDRAWNIGNLTDDGEYYEYEYDVFGRLRKVKNTTTQALVAEYKYNGLGFRISVHEDTDQSGAADGDVDGSDLWYHYVYDTKWRMVATFRADDNDPKVQYLYQQAGLDGRGGCLCSDRSCCGTPGNTPCCY